MSKSLSIIVSILLSLSVSFVFAQDETRRLWIGTYTGTGENDAKGIYTCELNLKDGSLTKPVLAAECVNPAFLAEHPYKPFLYAVGEIWGKYKNGGGPVYAFSADAKTGKLEPLNTEDVPGAGPCHLCVAAAKNGEAVVVVASYGGGSVSSLPVRSDGKLGKVASTLKHEGKLGPNEKRQEAPHPHGAYFFPGDQIAVPDLGLDRIAIYYIDFISGKLIASMEEPDGEKQFFAPIHAGAGPRHLAKHPKFGVGDIIIGVIVNELDSSVSVFSVEQPGEIPPSYSALPEWVDPAKFGNTTAEIFFHPVKDFFYVSNRGHDSISVFSIDTSGDPKKTPPVKLIQNVPCGGKTPRSFCIDPDGKFLIVASQDSNNLFVFKIDETTGKLTQHGPAVDVPKPACVIASGKK